MIKIYRFVLWILMFTLLIASSFAFSENWQSYDVGVVDTVTTFWDSSDQDFRTSVLGHESLQGNQSVFIQNQVPSSGRYIYSNSFPTVSSGVLNFWIEINASASSGDPRYTIGLFNTTASVATSGQAFAGIDVIGSNVYFLTGTNQTLWTHGASQSFTTLKDNPFYWRIKIDFDVGEMYFYQYDEDLTLQSQNDVVVDVPSSLLPRYIEVLVPSAGSVSHFLYADNLDLIVGNHLSQVSSVSISPDVPDVDQTLSCSYSFVDSDNDVDESRIVWQINGVPQSFYENNTYLPAGTAGSGEAVTCRVTAFDGTSNGNTASDSVTISGVSTNPDTVLNLSLQDSISISGLRGLDYYDDEGFSGYLTVVGHNSSGGFVTVIDLSNPVVFGNFKTQDISTFQMYAVSNYLSGFWTAGVQSLQRWNGVSDSLFFKTVSPDNYSNGLEVYTDVEAFNETHVAVCVYDSGNYFVKTYFYNSSGINQFGSSAVDSCNGLEHSNNILYVDEGLSGVEAFNLTNWSNPQPLGVLGGFNRDAYTWGVRHDTIGLSGNSLFYDLSGQDVAYEFDVSNPSSSSIVGGVCEISASTDDGGFYAVEMLDSRFVLFSNLDDGDLYACDYSFEGYAEKVYDYAFGVEIGKDIASFSEANQDYLYTFTDSEVEIFKFTTYDADVNQLPSFYETTPDIEYVDNLNPIQTNVSPVGLETPVVNVYPLTCVHPNVYDCALDSEGDTILFAVDKENDGVIDIGFTSVENEFVVYDSSGLKTMRIYLTDDVHGDNYGSYRDFTINVSGTSIPLGVNESTLKFFLKDSVTDVGLSGVSVSIDNSSAGFTNTEGRFVEVATVGTYLVEFSKTGYITQSHYYATSPLEREVLLQSQSDPDARILVVTVQDKNSTVLPNIFVEIYMPLTQTWDFAFTDASGKSQFRPVEDSVVISVEDDDYATTEAQVSVPLGSVIYKTIQIGKGVVASHGSCQDYISGVLICGMDEFNCSVNSDCPTGKCTYDGTCSSFNYTLCDEVGMDRGSRCELKFMFDQTAKSTSSWILDNFLYVLLIILFLLIGLVLSLKNRT